MQIIKHLKALAGDTSGATAVEYGLILAMVVLAMLGALQGVADVSTQTWNEVAQKSAAAM
jgi:pilus assembly protein Flp/PilA